MAREAVLKSLLRQHYQIDAVGINPGPRGFVAETHIVETADERFFAKLIPISRYSANVEASLPVLREMFDRGIRQINQPIETVGGALSLTLESDLFILFNFVDGEWTFDYPFDAYIDLLAQVHQITPRLRTPIKREMFSDPTLDLYEGNLEAVLAESFTNPHQQTLQQITKAYEAEQRADLNAYKRLMTRLQSMDPIEFVLTHGDAPGNILQQSDGKLHLIDWDDLMLAPRERDTWFHVGHPQFLTLYRRTYPEYELNQELYAFYLYKRYFEDLDGWYDKILSPETSDEQKLVHLEHLDKDYFGWLRPLVRALEVRW